MTPPWLAEALLRLVLDPADRDGVLGDLRELYARRARSDDRPRRWYWSQALRGVTPSLRRRFTHRRRTDRSPRSPRLPSRAVLGELGQALRALHRRPGSGLLAAVTLAVGIGAATSVFGVVEATILRPLPYPHADRLVTVWNTYPGWRGHEVLGPFWDRIDLSYPEYRDLAEADPPVEAAAIHGEVPMALAGKPPEELRVGLASETLFPLLGVSPALGRGFLPDEIGPGAARVAVLGHGLHRRRFGGDPSVVGERLILDGEPFTVVGVLPPDVPLRRLDGPAGTPDLWIPVGADGAELNRDSHRYEGLVRLSPGIDPEAAETAIAPVLSGGADPRRRGARVVGRQAAMTAAARGPLRLLLGAVALLATVAAANVGALRFGELERRRGELATRAAIGAGTARLGRQMVAEGLFLGLGGAGLGLGLAQGGVPLLATLAPASLGLPERLELGPAAVLFAAGLGMLSGVGVGLALAVQVGRSDPFRELRRQAAGAGPRTARLQRSLVAGEMALALVLVVATTLLGRSLVAELTVDPGFRHRGLLTFDLDLPESRYASPGKARAAMGHIVEVLESLPGVTGVTGSSALPFSDEGGSSSFQIVGREVPETVKKPEAERRVVLPGFHRALGVPLLGGRGIGEGDGPGAAPVAVVSRALGERYWPESVPVGQRIEWDGVVFEIVGVVGDVLHGELTGDASPTFYVPYRQVGGASLTLVVETDLDDSSAAIRRAVWSVDPELPVDRIRPFSDLVEGSAADSRFRTFLISAFGTAAVLLAALGVFGVAFRTAAARARELGVRLALGADRRRLLREILVRESTTLLGGLGVGLAVAVAGNRLLAGFLFGVDRWDPGSYALACAGLGFVGLTATWLAALHSTRLDPVATIRAE